MLEAAADKPVGVRPEEVDKPAAADKREEAGRPGEVDKPVEEAAGIQVAADKPVEVRPEEGDKPAAADKQEEGAEIALEESLLRQLACRMTRKSGHYPQDCGRNRCKNAEPFFTSLADFIRVQLLCHIRKAGSMGFSVRER